MKIWTRTTRMPAFWGLPILLSHIGSLVKKRQCQSYKFKEFAKISILEQTLHTTHPLKLLDKICKYEMDPKSIVEDTEQTRFCPQTDRQTDEHTSWRITQMYCDENRWRFFCLLRIIFHRVECTNWEYRRVRATHQLPVPQTHWIAVSVW